MNRKLLVLVVLLATILVGVWWYWHSLAQNAEADSQVETIPRIAIEPDEPSKAKSNGPSTRTISTEPATPNPNLPSKGQKMAQILSALNHKDIEFYGKVVDQSGTPLAGVEVNGQVIFNSGLSSGIAKPRTKTDANGLFEIKGVQGRTLDFYLIKPGFEFWPEGDAFDYTELVPPEKRHHPDANNPVVLKMWKLRGAEPLIHFQDRYFVLTPNGEILHVDLETGKSTGQGDGITVSLHHAEAASGQRLQRYPWRAEFNIPGGGLIESSSRLMNEAPQAGYSTMALQQTGEEPKYEKGMDRKLYFRTSSGCYGRMSIKINTDTSPDYPSEIILTWWLNPKPGSWNLEFDPAKVVKPTER